MSKDENKSPLSDAATALATGTILATTSGPAALCGLVTLLLDSVVSRRQMDRFKSELERIEASLRENNTLHPDNLSDAQFKLIGELISLMPRATDPEKMSLLGNAVLSGFSADHISDYEAVILIRALREITVVEYKHLVEHKDIETTVYSDTIPEGNTCQHYYLSTSIQADFFEGLYGMGLVSREAYGFGGDRTYKAREHAHRLIDMCSSAAG